MIPITIEMDSKMYDFGIMKTTVEIPKKELADLMKFTEATTKRAAINRAVEEFNRRARMGALTKYLGTFKDFMTQEELKKMRESGTHLW